MNSISNHNSVCPYLILLCLIGCQERDQEKEECRKFVNEKYIEEALDTALVQEAFEYQEILLERFDESSIKGLNHEAYHLQFYSSHGYGKSLKFEENIGACSLSVKCIAKEEFLPDCEAYQIEIDKEEWDDLVKMIYEFDFWTEEGFRANKDVLDGCVYFLEGNRPEAEKCNKKTYKLIGRGAPQYDKMGALCELILEYEDHLSFRYEQIE